VASLLSPLVERPGDCLLRNTRAGTVLADHVELAGDSASRRRGLLGRDHLDDGHALVIAPCGGVHTFFMRFAIDVLFVRRDGRVVKCAHAVRPWRIALAPTAYAAIECPAGTLRRAETRRGDRVAFEPASARPAPPA
jgi:uncharacterized membrane protein (UPF0127 family)